MSETFNLTIVNAQDVILHGKTIGTIEQRQGVKPEGDTWSRLTLIEREEGDWFIVGQRLAPGATGLVGDYFAITKPEIAAAGDESYSFMGLAKDEADATQRMVETTMKWLGWSFLAKEFAKKMGWNVISEVR